MRSRRVTERKTCTGGIATDYVRDGELEALLPTLSHRAIISRRCWMSLGVVVSARSFR